jgi:hypothetical protein
VNDRQVFEIQGLYGSYSVPESVLQNIWFNGDFNHKGLRTLSGKSISILNPGRLNDNEGPDFLEALLKIDGKAIVGSVEVHFEPIDWFYHYHHINPSFDSVILHVVLALGNHTSGDLNRSYFLNSLRDLETLTLLPYLNTDLENYAIEHALLTFEKKNFFDFKYLRENLSEAERIALFYAEAKTRFQRKVKFAKKRLEYSSWDEACHVMLLEVLGYSRNRLAMSNIGLHQPLANWHQSAEVLYEKYKTDWKLSGVRPANQPLTRLKQYTSLLEKEPNWPKRILEHSAFFKDQGLGNSINNRKRSPMMRKIKQVFQSDILHNFVGETRFHTIMIDAILPLIEAGKLMSTESIWLDWWQGDKPNSSNIYLKQLLSDQSRNPNRNAWIQGLYGLLIKQYSRITEIPNEHSQRGASKGHSRR